MIAPSWQSLRPNGAPAGRQRFVKKSLSHLMKSAIRRDHCGFTLVEIMVVVVVIGILATLALPQWQKVRSASQDKSVFNNIRQLAAAADQYFLEYGSESVALADLVGAANYVKSLATAASETYPSHYTQGVTITVTGVGGARTITYAP